MKITYFLFISYCCKAGDIAEGSGMKNTVIYMNKTYCYKMFLSTHSEPVCHQNRQKMPKILGCTIPTCKRARGKYWETLSVKYKGARDDGRQPIPHSFCYDDACVVLDGYIFP